MRGITVDELGVYVTGIYKDTIDIDPGLLEYNLVPEFNTSGSFSFDSFVLKLDSSGNFVWANTIGGKYDDFIKSISIDHHSNVYVTGFFSDTVDFDPSAYY